MIRGVRLLFRAVALTTPVLVAALSSPPPAPHGVQVHGHRGTRGTRPENTLAAFEEALRVGVDVLELDLGVTKDGVVVVSHEPEVTPALCNGPGGKVIDAPIPLRALTLQELKRFDCGSTAHPRFPRQTLVPGERIPTLSEVFDLVERSKHPTAKRVEFNIETKLGPAIPDLAPDPDTFATLVADVVRKRKLEKRVILQSFDHRTLRAMRRILPAVRLSALTSDNHLNYALLAKDLGAAVVSPDKDWITHQDVAALHKEGVQVAPWTVNDEAGWAKMLDLGVDAIITDYPEDLIAYLKKRGLR
ncbi:MAG: glycerophosphodiester phosphodiesterase [Proteobacteria bacterium]|nr:glycerophosphodiester phosphodiesterase [Pseudomonadota bacterium]